MKVIAKNMICSTNLERQSYFKRGRERKLKLSRSNEVDPNGKKKKIFTQFPNGKLDLHDFRE